jgi:hypothetical protein
MVTKLAKDKTLIELFKTTAKKLQDLKITERESYDEIINRIIPKENRRKK